MVKRIVEEGFRRWLQTSRNKFRLNNKFTIYTILAFIRTASLGKKMFKMKMFKVLVT